MNDINNTSPQCSEEMSVLLESVKDLSLDSTLLDKYTTAANQQLTKVYLKGYGVGARIVCNMITKEIALGRSTSEIQNFINIALNKIER